MGSKYYIAGDWGTSSCRLYLFKSAEVDGVPSYKVIDTLEGLGVSKLANTEIEAFFFDTVEPWLAKYQIEYVLLSGMVGATIGWREAGYAPCPTSIDKQLASGIEFTARGLNFTILGGVKTVNPLGLPDVMRGEETQLIGVSEQLAEDAGSVVILPGTHNKWVVLDNGSIRDFFTAFTGELFAILNANSILTSREPLTELCLESFKRGVMVARDSDADLVHLLFSTRSTQLASDQPLKNESAYMLGIVVGRDIASGLGVISKHHQITPKKIYVVASDAISDTYAHALSLFGIEAEAIDAEQVAQYAYPKFFN